MIIWLASYPKSGNTWLRSILSSLLYSKDGNFDFEQIYKIKQFPTREYFKQFTEKYHDVHELKKYWIPAQDLISLQNKIAFLKTHHINCKIDNYAFTNSDNTLATIYIVRDPRNLVKSFTNHYSMDKDKATKFITTPTPSFASGHLGIENKNNNIFTLIGCWKDHYISWTLNNKNLLLVKYENLLINPKKELERIITFLKNYIDFEFNNEKISNIVETTSFNNLKKIEKEGNFTENAFNKIENSKVNFFNIGKDNKWENLLDAKIENEIKKKFYKEMKELNYI